MTTPCDAELNHRMEQSPHAVLLRVLATSRPTCVPLTVHKGPHMLAFHDVARPGAMLHCEEAHKWPST